MRLCDYSLLLPRLTELPNQCYSNRLCNLANLGIEQYWHQAYIPGTETHFFSFLFQTIQSMDFIKDVLPSVIFIVDSLPGIDLIMDFLNPKPQPLDMERQIQLFEDNLIITVSVYTAMQMSKALGKFYREILDITIDMHVNNQVMQH